MLEYCALFLPTPHFWQQMGNFSIPSNSPVLCGHQLSILQVNSVCPTCTRAQLLQLSLTLCNPIDCSPLGSSVHGLSRQGHGSGLPCPPPGDIPDPGIKSTSAFISWTAGGILYPLSHLSSVQSLSCVGLFATPRTAAHQVEKLTQTHVHRVSDAIQNISSSIVPFSSRLQSLPASRSFPMSQFFASHSQSIGSFSFSISPSNEYSELISFRTHWFDLLAVQGTLKSLLQHHSSKASILSHPICPTSQFNSNINYLETAQCHRLHTPTRLPPTSEASYKSQASHFSPQQVINQGFPWPPPWVC